MAEPDKGDLAGLGAGDQRDQLRLRLVLRILFRCLPLLREAGLRHLFALLFLTILVLLSLVYPGFQIIDLFWTRVLSGTEITPQQIQFLALDPAVATDWNPEVRKMVLRRLVAVTCGIVLYATLCLTALYYYRIWFLQRINQILRLKLLDRFQTLSLRFHSDSAVGDAIYRMYQDSSMWQTRYWRRAELASSSSSPTGSPPSATLTRSSSSRTDTSASRARTRISWPEPMAPTTAS